MSIFSFWFICHCLCCHDNRSHASRLLKSCEVRYWPFHSLTHSDSCTCSLTCSLIHWLIDLIGHTFTYSKSQMTCTSLIAPPFPLVKESCDSCDISSLTFSLLTHSLTHSLTHWALFLRLWIMLNVLILKNIRSYYFLSSLYGPMWDDLKEGMNQVVFSKLCFCLRG